MRFFQWIWINIENQFAFKDIYSTTNTVYVCFEKRFLALIQPTVPMVVLRIAMALLSRKRARNQHEREMCEKYSIGIHFYIPGVIYFIRYEALWLKRLILKKSQTMNRDLLALHFEISFFCSGYAKNTKPTKLRENFIKV